MSGNLKMTVNVSLCGSIPRSEMNLNSCSSHCQSRLNQNQTELPQTSTSSCRTGTDQVIAMAASSLSRKVSEDNIVSNNQVIEPPSWAVPARGDSFLEPVSESRHLHRPLDLTTQAVYYIGRSDRSDLQLLHCASSRRHAILFHHPNGNCYVVDCGSAHGTYVNGVKVESTVSKNGVMPHRIRKGALVRFGGPGAPTFILKSFSSSLSSLMQHLERRKTVTRKTNIIMDEPPLSYHEKPTNPQSGGDDYSLDALVTLNTRLNSMQCVPDFFPSNGNEHSNKYSQTAALFNARYKQSYSAPAALHLRKRSLVSFDEESDEVHGHCHKRMKLSSSSGSFESSDSSSSNSIASVGSDSIINADANPAIVSPSRYGGKSVLHFDFSMIDRPVVSPNPFEDSIKTLELDAGILSKSNILTVPLSLSLPSTLKKKKRVMFSEEPPQIVLPASVTPEPESTSDNE